MCIVPATLKKGGRNLGCGMSTDRLIVTKVIVIRCELLNKEMLRYLYLSSDNERLIFIQHKTLTRSASTGLDIITSTHSD